MSPVKVRRVRGLKRVQKAIANIGKQAGPTLVTAMKRSILYIHQRVPEYPTASRKPQPFKTTIQRHHFFWLLARGDITVPYRRTGTLGRSVSTMAGIHPKALSRVEEVGSKIVGVIGTKVAYAPWVIDRERQADYHKGTWWTIQDVIEDNLKGVERIHKEELKRLVQDA